MGLKRDGASILSMERLGTCGQCGMHSNRETRRGDWAERKGEVIGILFTHEAFISLGVFAAAWIGARLGLFRFPSAGAEVTEERQWQRANRVPEGVLGLGPVSRFDQKELNERLG